MSREQEMEALWVLAERVVKHFPGFEIAGVGPGIWLKRGEKTRRGWVTVEELHMGTMAAHALVTGTVPERVLRED
jgi:hypothetical protein